MKVEILYFDGCPNHRPAVERVLEVLGEQGVPAQVSEVNVSDEAAAQSLRFLGSPTIRVNGLDVEPDARTSREYGMMCRTYLIDGRRVGLPSREMIRRALQEAGSGEPPPGSGVRKESTNASWLAAGSIAASIVASFCCILPLVFALTGFSILGASALFAAWRPYLLAVTLGLLAMGFYYAYRPGGRPCAPGSVCAIPAARRSGRLVLWLAAAAVILFAAFPYYSGPVANLLLSQRPAGGLP